jgi:hypothetical protein
MLITLRLCFVWLSVQTVTFVLYIVNRLVFITEAESVYCAVRIESLLLLLLLLLVTAIELSLGGSSSYTSTYKTNKNKYT